jgi:hypothetical protein
MYLLKPPVMNIPASGPIAPLKPRPVPPPPAPVKSGPISDAALAG